MLGLRRPEQRWLWAARGKHPSASDYFSIGRDFPTAVEFSEWIKKGYSVLAEREHPARTLRSWRFWTRSNQKNDFVCGLLRDCHDSIGRPYPLLFIGSGPLPFWEKSWETLPSACEKTWRQLEFLSTQKFGDLRILETEMLKTRPPYPEPAGFHCPGGNLSEVTTLARENGPILDRLKKQVIGELPGDEGKVSIVAERTCDSFTMIMYISHVLKEQLPTAPNAVFIGGTFDESRLVYFRRPMRITDFKTLWLSGSDNGQVVNSGGAEAL